MGGVLEGECLGVVFHYRQFVLEDNGIFKWRYLVDLSADLVVFI